MPPSHHPVPISAKASARAMRKAPTEAERALWRILRSRRLAAMKWRRQVPLGPFIADFVSFEHRLIVECDGAQHAENPRDAARDAWLRAQGFAVQRFWNHEILQQATSVTETILARCGLPW